MDKKMILTSLASVTVLGAVFAVYQPSVVKADALHLLAHPEKLDPHLTCG